MGDVNGQGVEPVQGDPAAIAEQLATFAAAGARHLQLVVDPITIESIETLGGVLESLDQR